MLNGYVSCGLCGADAPIPLFEMRVYQEGLQVGVVRCGKCGMVYRNYRDEQAQRRFYAKEYFPAEIKPEWIRRRSALYRHVLGRLEHFRQNNRILDVGAGPGLFLKLCRESHWQCQGVEISEHCVEWAEKQYGLKLFPGSLSEAQYPAESFDVVTFWNVLDQLPDPVASLREAHRVLRPGGAIFIRVPNATFHLSLRRMVQSLSRLVPAIRRWDKSVIHLFCFNRRSLFQALEISGFEKIQVENSLFGYNATVHPVRRVVREFLRVVLVGLLKFAAGLSGGKVLLSPSLFAQAIRPDGGKE